jgi:segregation and condensation protein A
MKAAAHRLNELPQAGRDFSIVHVIFERDLASRLPEVSPAELKIAWLALFNRAAVNQHHTVTREQLSVRAHMSAVLRRLQEAKFIEFAELFQPEEGVAVLVVTFLAVLELAREGLIEVSQQEPYSTIYVKLRSGQLAAVA